MRLLSCLSLLGLIATPASAQQITGGIVGGVVQAGAQPPRDFVPAVGRSTIRGRVLATDGGMPMRRATVRLNTPDARASQVTSTDAEGRYEFRALPAGRYTINASKPAYLSWTYGQTRPNATGKPIALADNQIADNIDIRLPRGAVIVGRVVDEFGEPVANAGVAAVRQQYQQGQRRLMASGPRAQTNDIGEYRLFGLTPGQYYVSATAQAQTIGMPTANGIDLSGERSGFAPTFYPATPDVASAQRLTVGSAQTLTGIDVSLVPARLASISGIALDSQGRPIANGGVQLTQRGAGSLGIGNFGGPVRPDGTFTIPNVTPGEYILRVNSLRLPQTLGTAPGGPPEFSVAVVTVNGEDVTGVRLAPITQVMITGRISFDDAAAAQSIKASTLRVMSMPLNPEDSLIGFGSGGIPDSTVHDDFTFELKVFPGRIGLRAFAPGLPGGPNAAGGWQLKSIRANGVDVLDSGIDLGSQGLSGVEIEMTNRVQQVSGTAADARGDAVKDYMVLVFSQDRARWLSATNRYTAISRPSEDGTFKVTTLPPGEYYAIALDGIDLTDWQDPETLEGLSRLATPFALTAGDTRKLDLRLSAP
jgi:Carboxypeptidase regulatory-like domain